MVDAIRITYGTFECIPFVCIIFITQKNATRGLVVVAKVSCSGGREFEFNF
jgi:hypothetical protein